MSELPKACPDCDDHISIPVFDEEGTCVGYLSGELRDGGVVVTLDYPKAICFAMFMAPWVSDQIYAYGAGRFGDGLKTASANVQRIKELATELESGTRLGQDAIEKDSR